ncbi:MAG TPA: PVC-type heme-binding CxxCH protein [Gemmataceae bacterium]|nr:PVC-type heme-binding CxxCH protein [Gemmataceae bacterium]
MSRAVCVVLFVTLTLFAADERTPAPLPAERAAREMVLPEGFQGTLFAAEPDVVQPISFTIDDRGRLWVAEALNYGEWKPTGKDRIVILEDTDGDGRADQRTVFYEGFNYVTGLEVGFGGVWVLSPPGLYFVPDRDGDGKPDGPPELLFDGFGYKESRHNLANGFTWGPDGWLYAGHGRTSPSDVGRPGTPADKRVHCDGGVYRIHPTRLVFENFADGTTNPWGVDFDDFGQCFVSNCVNPHLFHMIQGGHYEPWRNRPSSRFAYERLPTCADHLHYPGGDLRSTLGTAQTLEMGGGHAHCGTLVYLGGAFPADFRNNVFMCNIHGRRINRDILKRKGSGYVASHAKDLAISADPWFMGVTLRAGPDGSVYVSDWSDTGECHTYKPNTQTGRIYKISYGPAEKARVDLAKKSDDELVKLQLSKNDWFVRHARRLLQERASKPDWKGEAVHAALRDYLESAELDLPQRLRGLWALHVTGGLETKRILALLGDRSDHIRAWAVQFLCEDGEPSTEAPARFAALAKSDPSAVVRLYLASALQRLPPRDGWAIAEGLLSHAEDAADTNLPLMIWYGVEPLVPTDPGRAMRLAVEARIPLVRRFIARRVADEAILRGEKGDLAPWAAALADATESVRLDLLQGAREALRGQKSMKAPTGWADAYVRLAKSTDAAVREQAAVLALVFGDQRALADLWATAELRTTPAATRLKAMETLIEHHVPNLAPLLHDALADDMLRGRALRGLAGYDHPDTPKRILTVYPKLTTAEKHEAVATLASRPAYALALLDAVERNVVPRADISAYVARQLHAMNDAKVEERLQAVWGDVRDTPADKKKQMARYKSLLTPAYLRGADLSNGRLMFSKACQQCHKLYGEGGTIGPDLTGSNRSDLDYLLSNLIDPSAEVGRDYRMSVIQTASGRVVTGIVVERSPARVVVQTATEKVVLAAEDVESIKDSALSIMPDNQLESLTREQVRDLIAYLRANRQVTLPVGQAPK